MSHIHTLSGAGPHIAAAFAFLFAGLMMAAQRKTARRVAHVERSSEDQRSAYNARNAARDEVDAELPNVGRDDRELLAIARAVGYMRDKGAR